jgi:hypothetical protein
MPSALTHLHAPLVLTICDEHRIDRPEAKINATSAGMVVALHCPSCGGAIDVQVGERSASCPFCKTACRIPSRTLLSLKKQNDRPRPWWALFRGPSPKRIELEQPVLNPFGGHPAEPMDGPSGQLEDPPANVSRNAKLADRAFAVVVPLVVFVVVSAVLFAPVIWGWIHGYGSDTPPPELPFPYPW